jgi:tubulin polyglutamylase TTLL6/13
VVVEVAEHLNWKVQYNNDAGDWDIYWTDFAIDPDILIKMNLFQKINHYPGIHVIARKNLLGLSLMSLRNHFPD